MPTYDYTCGLGHTTEERRGLDESSIPCPFCGDTAHREAVNQYVATITETGGKQFPKYRTKDEKGRYRVSNFQEASEEINHAYEKEEKKEGREIPRPDLYRKGLAEAQRRGAKLRTK